MYFLHLLFSSISATHLIITDHLPVEYAVSIASLSYTIPHVGKSGHLIKSSNSEILTSHTFSCFNKNSIASHNSVKLCGGIFVAIQTAIPITQFISKLGILFGNTVGSFLVES